MKPFAYVFVYPITVCSATLAARKHEVDEMLILKIGDKAFHSTDLHINVKFIVSLETL